MTIEISKPLNNGFITAEDFIDGVIYYHPDMTSKDYLGSYYIKTENVILRFHEDIDLPLIYEEPNPNNKQQFIIAPRGTTIKLTIR